jgi:hypothetical protein
MRITVQMPVGTATLDVADNVLVFNGEAYVQPSQALYLDLYTLPVAAVSAPILGLSQALSALVSIRAKVLSLDPTIVPYTDPSIVQAPDPSGGMCVCGVTCSGTDIRFAVVQQEN